MKAITAVIAMVMVLLLSSAIMAATAVEPEKTYIVQSGDWLIKIGQKVKTGWKQIAKINNLKDPYIIYPGQKLIIPENRWEKVGGNPYQGTWQKALENFDLPAKVKKQVKENIRNNNFNWLESGLKSGQKLNQVVFGQNKVWHNVICQWSKTQLYAAKDYGIGDYHVIQVLKCKNWTWWVEKKPVPVSVPVIEKKLIVEALPSFPLVPLAVSPKEYQKEEITAADMVELYIGSGNYESVYYDAQGHYFWGKIRYKPFEFNISDNLNLRLGIFGFTGLGQGNDGDYDYSWKKWVIGPTVKLIGLHWDADFDGGIGQHYDKGGIDLYRSEQVDDIFLFSAHGNFYGRRDRGKKWLPKTELNLELTLPYHQNHQHSWHGDPLVPDPNDNRVVELSLTQGICDIKLSDHLRLTPGFNLGVGREYGQEKNFYQLGPRATLTWHNQDIISISFLNYKEQLDGDGDQWHWLGGWLNISGLIKAYQIDK